MPSQPHKDYSGTPLPKKLGIREGSEMLLVAAPPGFALGSLPAGVTLQRRARGQLDVIMLFVTRRAELDRRFGRLAALLAPSGRLWVAWPKKAAKFDTDLSFEVVQRTGPDAGLVDNKSASIDGVYQGLQFVIRVKDRPGR